MFVQTEGFWCFPFQQLYRCENINTPDRLRNQLKHLRKSQHADHFFVFSKLKVLRDKQEKHRVVCWFEANVTTPQHSQVCKSNSEQHCDSQQNEGKYTFFIPAFWGSSNVDIGPLWSQKASIKCTADTEPYAELLQAAYMWMQTENGVRHLHCFGCYSCYSAKTCCERRASLTNIHYMKKDTTPDDSWLQACRYHWRMHPLGKHCVERC